MEWFESEKFLTPVYLQTFGQYAEVARRGGTVAREARERLELETGKPVVSPLSAKQTLQIRQKDEKYKDLGRNLRPKSLYDE